MNDMNVTSSAMASLSPEAVGWLITIMIFLGIILTVFLISKYFRQFLYGAIVSAILLIVYKVSRWIGVETINKNYDPITEFGWVAGFIWISVIIGYFIRKIKAIKDWEKKILK